MADGTAPDFVFADKTGHIRASLREDELLGRVGLWIHAPRFREDMLRGGGGWVADGTAPDFIFADKIGHIRGSFREDGLLGHRGAV